MSYCRSSIYSDVYVINGDECCGCKLNNNISQLFKTKVELLAHLRFHRRQGDLVPEYAIYRLKKELNLVHPNDISMLEFHARTLGYELINTLNCIDDKKRLVEDLEDLLKELE